MEELMNSVASMGVVGVFGGVLFKTFLEEKKQDKEHFRAENKAIRELHKEELEKDRAIYIESIDKITSSIGKITSKIDSIEDDVKEIKEHIRKGE